VARTAAESPGRNSASCRTGPPSHLYERFLR
jgi:hypothetical protein